jgi:hypothetical protein
MSNLVGLGLIAEHSPSNLVSMLRNTVYISLLFDAFSPSLNRKISLMFEMLLLVPRY